MIRTRIGESRSSIGLTEESFPTAELKHDGLRAEPRPTPSTMANYTGEVPQASFNDASVLRRAKPCFGTYTQAPAGTMRRLGRS